MQPLELKDIRGTKLYEGFRDDMRKKIIEIKKARRIDIGDRLTLVFENRQTLLFQIQEILRAEGISEPDKIQEEIDVYNPLLPDDDSLSATLLLAVPPDADPRVELDRLIGLDEHVVLEIGDHAVRAEFEPGRSTKDRISAVQFTRYRLPTAAMTALKTANTPVAIRIDHPGYQHRTECDEATRVSLAADFD